MVKWSTTLAYRFPVQLTLNIRKRGRPGSDPRPAVVRTREHERRLQAQPSANTNPVMPTSSHRRNSPETKATTLLAADSDQATHLTLMLWTLVADCPCCLYQFAYNRQTTPNVLKSIVVQHDKSSIVYMRGVPTAAG